MGKPHIIPKISIVILCILIFHAQPNMLFAQEDTTDAQIQERLAFIVRSLEEGKRNADLWWFGWLAGYSAATVAQGAVGLASDDERVREDMALGAATTFLGALGQLIAPMTPSQAPKRLSALPESTPSERKEKLKQAENWLERSALREKNGRSWKTHALTAAVNLGGGLVVWLGFDRSPAEGLLNFVLNTAVTEIQIWTQPTRAIRDYKKIMDRIGDDRDQHPAGPELNWQVSVRPGGFCLTLNF